MAAASNLIIAARRRLAHLHSPVRRLNSTAPFSSPPPSLFSLRAGHWSAYEKNPEEEICPTVVPDHMIHSLSEHYWAPHPQTGVFGPPITQLNPVPNDTSAGGGGCKEGSVLDLKVWFRHSGLEDPEKPHSL